MISNSFHNLLISAYSAITRLNYPNQFIIYSTAAANLTDGWFWSCDKNISGSNYCMNANEVMSTQANDSANSSFWNAFSDLSKLSYCYCTQKTKHIKLWRSTDRLMTVCIWLHRFYRKYSSSAFVVVQNFMKFSRFFK